MFSSRRARFVSWFELYLWVRNEPVFYPHLSEYKVETRCLLVSQDARFLSTLLWLLSFPGGSHSAHATWSAGETDCLLREWRHRYNQGVSERRRLGFPKLGFYDTWLIDSLQLLVEATASGFEISFSSCPTPTVVYTWRAAA